LVAVSTVASGISMALEGFGLMTVGTGPLPDLYEETQKLVVVEAE
jgi:hypothetical protein